MSDNQPADDQTGRFSRRGVILTIAIVVVVLLIVAFVVHAAVTKNDAGNAAAPTSSVSIKPSPTSSPGYTAAPKPKPTKSIPVVQPSGTAKPGTQAKPVPLTATAQPVSGVHVKLTDLKAVQGKAKGVGEIDGPALQFSVVFTNDTSSGIPLSSVVVNVTYGSAQTPADELMSARKPLPAALAKGQTATGTYTFTLAEADRSDVQITVDYHVGVPITVFTGSAPR